MGQAATTQVCPATSACLDVTPPCVMVPITPFKSRPSLSEKRHYVEGDAAVPRMLQLARRARSRSALPEL